MNGSQPKASKEKAKPKTRAAASKRKSQSKTQDVKKLYELGTAFWASGALIAAVKLGMFTRIGKDSVSIDVIARRLGANRRWTEKLVVACAAIGLLEQKADLFKNSPLAAQFLVEGEPYYQGAFIGHLSGIWQNFGSLDYTVKTGKRAPASSSSASAVPNPTSSESGRDWILSSHEIAMSGQAESLARALDLKDRKRLCDVGGGPGTYSIVLCWRNPNLRATVLDDPEVVPVAKEMIAKFGLEDRVEAKASQLLYRSYGEGYDVLLLSGVLHGLSESNCKKVLQRAFSALAPGGMIVIQEMVIDDFEPKPIFPALFSLNMTLGESYSAAQIMSWLYATGFVKVEVKELKDAPWLDHLIIAKKV